MSETKVLIIDDEVEVGTFFRRLLKKKDFDVTVALSGVEAYEMIKEKTFNVAMVDLKLPDADGLYLLQQIKNRQPDCEVIIMTGYSTTRTAVKAIQLGAFDYLEKPFEDIDEVESLIQKAAEYGLRGCDGRPVNAEWALIASSIGFQVGNSPVMHKLVSIAHKIARKRINVLIQGETGTGKEVLARFIHAASDRSGRIFIPVNCGALPENLLESELFGHEKGAFTGAGNMRRGIFEMANRGTLFLDEVGESSLAIQVKLLRVLETGEFFRVGGERPIKTDVRVIAASNVDLTQAMKEKTFREDLYYRLDGVRLELPPLRARREDIPLLAEYFVKNLNPDQYISIEAMRLLCYYPWPGNIRELANKIRQAVALCDDKIILPKHLGEKLVSEASGTRIVFADSTRAMTVENPRTARQPDENSLAPLHSLEAILEHYASEKALDSLEESSLASLKVFLDRLENNLAAVMRKRGMAAPSPSSIEELEAVAIRDALNYYRGNITMASKALGIGRNTLYRKMKEYADRIR